MAVKRLACTLLVLLATRVSLSPSRGVQGIHAAAGMQADTVARLAAPAPVRAIGRIPAAPKVHHYHMDVGGYKLAMVCSGKGSPSVVFEAGAGIDWSTWYKVMPGPASPDDLLDVSLRPPGDVQYCAYDRAGEGMSEASPLLRDSKSTVRELHNAALAGPHRWALRVGGAFDWRPVRAALRLHLPTRRGRHGLGGLLA